MGGTIHPPAHAASDEDPQRGRDRQIDPDGEGQRRDAAQLEHQGDHHPDQHQIPGQLPVEHALDDVADQHGLRGVVLGDRRAVGQLRLGARDRRIDQPDGLTRIVDQPLARHTGGVGLMPDPVFLGIDARHRPDEMGPRGVDQCLGRGHQARGDLRSAHVDGARVVHGQQHPPHHHRRGEGSDQDGDLLMAGGASDQESRLQVLRGRAAIGTGDAHDASHG